MQLGEGQEKNTRARFLIQIQYRHNSTWQGRVVWLDTKQTVVFRSFMELAMLMWEALGAERCIDQLDAWEIRGEVL